MVKTERTNCSRNSDACGCNESSHHSQVEGVVLTMKICYVTGSDSFLCVVNSQLM